MSAEAAIKEFLDGIKDVNGRVYKAAYKSFTRGQIEKEAYAMRVGIAHNIDPRILIDAAFDEHVRMMLGASEKSCAVLNAK